MPLYEAATTEEAIQQGLKTLSIAENEAEINVISESKKGFLGFGRKNALVSVEKIVLEKEAKELINSSKAIPENESEKSTVSVVHKESEVRNSSLKDAEQSALNGLSNYLSDVSRQLGASATVKIEEKNHVVIFHLETSKPGLLIGKHGKTINALQYLAQVYMHRLVKNKMSLVINVGDYREKRQEIIQRLAERTADKVRQTKQPVFLEPMPAFERKQVHAILSKNKDVKTHSEGDEPYRYLVVEPK